MPDVLTQHPHMAPCSQPLARPSAKRVRQTGPRHGDPSPLYFRPPNPDLHSPMLQRRSKPLSRSVVFHRGVVCRPQERCGSGAAPRHPAAVVILGALLVSLLAFAFISCSTTREGIEKEQQISNTASNIVQTVAPAALALPPPYSYLAEGIFAVIGSGLAAWNLSQARRLKDLEAVTSCTNYSPKEPACAGPPPQAESVPVVSRPVLP